MDARSVPAGVGSQGALTKATLVGTALQLAMVLAGHYSAPIRESGFAIIGTGIAAVTGFLFSRWAGRGARMGSATGGAIAAGVGGFIGTIVSAVLGDVPGQTIGVGTISSVVAGLAGGAIGHRSRA
jgi:hypothetical protein